MGYVYLLLAGILPRGSKNNVLQWFVQFLLGLPVPIHMSSFCWGRRCPFVGATEKTSGCPGAVPGHPEGVFVCPGMRDRFAILLTANLLRLGRLHMPLLPCEAGTTGR